MNPNFVQKHTTFIKDCSTPDGTIYDGRLVYGDIWKDPTGTGGGQ